MLQVSLGAGYAGFTEPVGRDEPARWYPAGRRTFARLVGDDRAQARALVRAAGAKRIVVEAEGDEDSQALAAEVRGAARAAGARVAESPGRRGAVIYAGSDPVSAAGVAESVAGESPGARVVLPDEVARAGVEGCSGAAPRAPRCSSRARRRRARRRRCATSRPPSGAPTAASRGPTRRSDTRR